MGSIILLFLVLLTVLVLVHELGHFIMARRHGMGVEEFGFGFPPRLVGLVRDAQTNRWKVVWGNKIPEEKNTIYSLNLLPLGGFVRITGENGDEEDKDNPLSFANKPIGARFQVLVAGVIMNFLLAWALFSAVFMVGAPEAVENDTQVPPGQQPAVHVAYVVQGSPAEQAGVKVGDEIIGIKKGEEIVPVTSIKQVQQYVSQHRGKEVTLVLRRGKKTVEVTSVPRLNPPEGEGALGIAMVRTVIIRYNPLEAVVQGAKRTWEVTALTFQAFGKMIGSFIATGKAPADLSGPVGIAYLTKQVADLGLVYVLQFAALLSVNLGILNALPIPALDGGRMLFLLIEALKGSPVRRELEGKIHIVGFVLLLLLMVVITFHDLGKFQVFQKFGW